MTGEFRSHLFPHDHPRLASVRGMDAYQYREHAHRPGTFTGGLVQGWRPLYRRPFRGITNDGVLRDLDEIPDAPRDGEAAPVDAMVAAALDLLASVGAESRRRICYPVDAVEWQTWSNPEFLQFDTGVRLEFEPGSVRRKALALVAASLSPRGYELVRAAMRINAFLGTVVDLPTILNEFSYNVALYGDPDPTRPWGWQLFGHHCAVNCLVAQGQMTISPVFLGAEPDEIDSGPYAGISRPFGPLTDAGLALVNALPAQQRGRAVLYDRMVDPAMPSGRIHPGDERHLGGAFQDNRIIPYEGLCVTDMPAAARNLVRHLACRSLALLPDGPRRARMREIDRHLDETWFCWIGGHRDGDAFYYRLQSPVILTELDHHCGVFLDYDTPQPFHVHTIVRTPNGGDYGRHRVEWWRDSAASTAAHHAITAAQRRPQHE